MRTKPVSRIRLLFALLPIMAVAFYGLSIMSGPAAETVFTPPEMVESISLMKEAPSVGAPSDYTPTESFSFANYNIYNASYFQSESKGSAKANLGFTSYTQNISARRKVKNKTLFTETVSSSAFVSNAEQTYVTPDNVVLIRLSKSVHGDNVVWSDKISPMSAETFFTRFGSVPREVTKYAVTTDTIVSAELTSMGGGEYVYEFVLDPVKAGEYFRKEISTRSGSTQPVEILSAKLTLTLDKDWYVKKAVSEDRYTVFIPALGSVTCDNKVEETFSRMNEDLPLEESKLFEPFLPKVGETIADPEEEAPEKNASSFLAEAFSPYLEGEPLLLSAEIEAYGAKHIIGLRADLAAMNIDAIIDDDIYVGYDGDNVYLSAGNIRGYLPAEEFKRLISSGVISLPGDKIDFSSLKNDLTSDLIGSLFAGSTTEKADGVVTVNLKFRLSDVLKPESKLYALASKISAEVAISMTDGEKASLKEISAILSIDGVPVSIKVTPIAELVFPDRTTLPSLSGLLDFVPAAVNTASAAAYKFDISLSLNSPTFSDDISAEVFLNKDLSLRGSATIEKAGVSFDFAYVNDCLYLSVGSVKVKLNTSDFKDVYGEIKKVLGEFGTELPDLSGMEKLSIENVGVDLDIRSLLNLDMGKLLSAVKEFSIKDKTLSASIAARGVECDLSVSHDGNVLSSLIVDKLRVLDLSLVLSMNLKCLSSPIIVMPEGEYYDVKDVVSFVRAAAKTINSTSFNFEGKLVAAGLSADFNISFNRDLSAAIINIVENKYSLSIDVVYTDGTIYLSALDGKVKLQANGDDLTKLNDAIVPLLPDSSKMIAETAIAAATSFLNGDFAALKELLPKTEIKAGNVLEKLTAFRADENALSATFSGIDVSIEKDGDFIKSAKISGILNDTPFSLSLVLLNATGEVLSPSKPTGYVRIGELAPYITAINSLLNKRTFVVDFDASVTVGAETFSPSGRITLLFKESCTDFELTLNVPQKNGENIGITIAVASKRLYLSYINSDGAIRVSADKGDYDSLMQVLSPVLPKFAPRLIADIKNRFISETPSVDFNSVVAMLDGISSVDTKPLIELTAFDMHINAMLSLSESGQLGLDARLFMTNATAGDVSLGLRTTSLTAFDDADKTLPCLANEYVEAARLIAYVDSLVNTFKQDAYSVTFDGIDVYYADKTHRVTGYVQFLPTSGIPNLRMGLKVYERLKTEAELLKDAERGAEGPRFEIPKAEAENYLLHSFDIMITDGDPLQEIYLEYNGIKFKLTIEELTYIIGNVKDALGIKDGTILDSVLPKDREIVSGAFIGDFKLSAITDMSKMLTSALSLLTDVSKEFKDFMYNPDYDYNKIADSAKDTLSAAFKLMGADSAPSVTVKDVFSALSSLPKITLSEKTENGLSTLKVSVDETLFTLTRSIEKNRLTNWTFTNLATKKTVTDFSLSLECPPPSEIAAAVARPRYHDYNYATSFGGTYKRQEFIDNILAGKVEGLSLPNYRADYVKHDISYGDDDVIKSRRYAENKWTWITNKYDQRDTGNYVQVRNNGYKKIGDFIDRIRSGEYVEYNGEYWTYADFVKLKNTVIDNGKEYQLDDYFENWFLSEYGMSSEEYKKAYLEGNILNDFSNISSVTTALLNTANRKNFAITGGVTINVPVIGDVYIPLDIRVKIVSTELAGGTFENKPLVMIGLSTPQKKVLWETLLAESHTQITYWNGFVYFTKYQDGNYYRLRMTMEELNATTTDKNKLTDLILFVLPMKGLAASQLRDGLTKPSEGGQKGKFEDYFKFYYNKDNRHCVSIDLAALTGDSTFSVAEAFVGTTRQVLDGKEQSVMRELGVSTKIAGLLNVNIELVLETGNNIFTYRTYNGSGYEEHPIFDDEEKAFLKSNILMYDKELNRSSYDSL